MSQILLDHLIGGGLGVIGNALGYLYCKIAYKN